MVNFPCQVLRRVLNRSAYALTCLSTTLILGAGAGVLLGSGGAVAAERMVLTYGAFSRSIPIQDLKAFAETGATSSTVDFLLNATDVNESDVRRALTYKVALDLDFVDSALYSLPGEYVLFEAGNIFHTKSRVANIQALRAAFTLSVSDDGKVSILEFLQKYPNQDFYIDGVVLIGVTNDVSRFVKQAEKELEQVFAIAKDFLSSLICDCENPQPTSEDEVSNRAIPTEAVSQ